MSKKKLNFAAIMKEYSNKKVAPEILKEHLRNYIKIVRLWQELFLMEIKFYNISENKIRNANGFGHRLYKKYSVGVASYEDLGRLKNHIIVELTHKDEDLASSCLDSFLEDCKHLTISINVSDRMDLEDDYRVFYQNNQMKTALKAMQQLALGENLPPIDTNISRNQAYKRILKLTGRTK